MLHLFCILASYSHQPPHYQSSCVIMTAETEKPPVIDFSPAESIIVDNYDSPRPLQQEDGDATIPRHQMSSLRWVSVCVGLYLSSFLYGLDSTIAADVQGPIYASLGNLNLLSWIGTGFLLGSVTTVSLFGSLYSRMEVKWLYLGSILLFEVGSAICGAAPNMQVMTVGRVLAGVGGSGMYIG